MVMHVGVSPVGATYTRATRNGQRAVCGMSQRKGLTGYLQQQMHPMKCPRVPRAVGGPRVSQGHTILRLVRYLI